MYKHIGIAVLILAPLVADFAARHAHHEGATPDVAPAAMPAAPAPTAAPAAVSPQNQFVQNQQPTFNPAGGIDPTPTLDPTPPGSSPAPEAPPPAPPPEQAPATEGGADTGAPVS